jgi:hypothetical protein
MEWKGFGEEIVRAHSSTKLTPNLCQASFHTKQRRGQKSLTSRPKPGDP